MIRSLAIVPAMLCAAALVSAQAPAGRPAGDPADQPAVQQPATPAAPQSPSASIPSSMAGKVTYTGCVKPGTTPGTFILDSAELSPAAGASSAAGQSPVGTSGTKATLNLTTKAGTDLKPHANHKVEVVGSVAPPKAGAAADASASAKPNIEFNVDSFKMVSASCQ